MRPFFLGAGLLGLAAFCAVPVCAQEYRSLATDPSGYCDTDIVVNVVTGVIWTCVNRQYVAHPPTPRAAESSTSVNYTKPITAPGAPFTGPVEIDTTLFASAQGVNVKAKGAKCDGVTADDAAFASALRAAAKISKS